MLLGIFAVSVLHNIVHLLFGVAGIAFARSISGSRNYLIGGGAVYAVLGLYGLIKSSVGPRVAALPGLAAETAVLTPLAVAYLAWLHATGAGTFAPDLHGLALVGTGVVTAVPLLLFNTATRRLPLSTVGMLQYLAPVLQLAIGVLVAGEQMPPARWWGFALVWVALVLLTVDGWRRSRRPRPRSA